MALSGVPVKILDDTIGSALINDDGTIDLNVDSPSTAGKELLARFEAGDYVALMIRPERGIPRPVPADPPTNEVAVDVGALDDEMVRTVPADVQLVVPQKSTKGVPKK